MNGSDLYLLSVFDLEPSGVIVHAYNQADSKEYILPVSEMEVRNSTFSLFLFEMYLLYSLQVLP